MYETRILPGAIILISVGASVVYGLDGNWRQMIYWIAAAVLSASVTF